MSWTFDGVKHGVTWREYAWNDMQMRLCVVKLGVVSSIFGDFGEESGGDARTHNLLLTGIYKGSGVRMVLLNLKTFVHAKSSFCAYIHF